MVEPKVVQAIDDYYDESDSDNDVDSIPGMQMNSIEAIKKVRNNKKFGIADGKINIKEIYDKWTVIGHGAFGTVYRATHKQSQHVRAIKELKITEKQQRKAILNEFYVLLGLNHPNVVKLIEKYEMGDKIYLVYEYLSGD